jgi:hypothetical protein
MPQSDSGQKCSRKHYKATRGSAKSAATSTLSAEAKPFNRTSQVINPSSAHEKSEARTQMQDKTTSQPDDKGQHALGLSSNVSDINNSSPSQQSTGPRHPQPYYNGRTFPPAPMTGKAHSTVGAHNLQASPQSNRSFHPRYQNASGVRPYPIPNSYFPPNQPSPGALPHYNPLSNRPHPHHPYYPSMPPHQHFMALCSDSPFPSTYKRFLDQTINAPSERVTPSPPQSANAGRLSDEIHKAMPSSPSVSPVPTPTPAPKRRQTRGRGYPRSRGRRGVIWNGRVKRVRHPSPS